jgi:hypothetical protein
MFAFKLIQLVETRAEPLSEGLMRRLKKNDRCIELLRRVPSDELRIRSHEIYRNLNDWLRNKTESEIEERYIGLGMKRAKQGVPYADFLWAISTTKEHLWEFMQGRKDYSQNRLTCLAVWTCSAHWTGFLTESSILRRWVTRTHGR